MADDFAGLKQTLHEAADQIIKDVGAAWGMEKEVTFFKSWWAKVRERAAANGVTNL